MVLFRNELQKASLSEPIELTHVACDTDVAAGFFKFEKLLHE